MDTALSGSLRPCQQVMLLMVIERNTCEQLCLATMPEKFNPHHFRPVSCSSKLTLRVSSEWRERIWTMLPVASMETGSSL